LTKAINRKNELNADPNAVENQLGVDAMQIEKS